jgi:hypothetical protein
MLTLMLRPSMAVSFSARIAASASAWIVISTKPKPFDVPVRRPLMSLAVSTLP